MALGPKLVNLLPEELVGMVSRWVHGKAPEKPLRKAVRCPPSSPTFELTMMDTSLNAVLTGALAVTRPQCGGADAMMTVPRYRQSPKFGVVQFEQVQTKLVRLVRFVEVRVARLPHAKHSCVA